MWGENLRNTLIFTIFVYANKGLAYQMSNNGNPSRQINFSMNHNLDNSKKLSRIELMEFITQRVDAGYVLDSSKMKTDRICYLGGEYDSINDEWLPCLVKNPEDKVAVDYFEKNDPIPLEEQVGIKGNGYELNEIKRNSLLSIYNAMVKL